MHMHYRRLIRHSHCASSNLLTSRPQRQNRLRLPCSITRGFVGCSVTDIHILIDSATHVFKTTSTVPVDREDRHVEFCQA